MQDQNASPWSWNQGGSQSYPPSSQTYPPTYTTGSADQSQLMAGYPQMYSGTTSQQAPDYGASQWNMAQFQHWQQWQQWQEKYQQWQAQYGKKYAESLAAMGQNPNVMMPSVPAVCGVMKPCEMVPNPGYATANPPPPPCNAQPVPPPPPEEEKSISGENPEELSEAEKTFDIQFKQWEDQFNDWKKQNQDHPDKAQYREYEKKWENWREQLLQRREQMRKKRLNKNAEGAKDSKNLGKNEEAKAKGEQDKSLIKGETGNITSTGEGQNPSDQQSMESASFGREESEGAFLQDRLRDENQLPNPNFSEANYNPFGDNRIQGYPERESGNFGNQPFGAGILDRNNPKFGTDGNRDRFGMASRMENWNRGEFFHRRSFGNGNFDEDRNFGSRFGNVEEGRNFGSRFGAAEEARNFGSRFGGADEGRNFGPRFSNLEDERVFRFGNVEDERNFGPRFGNAGDEERGFGPRFGNVDGRKPSQDRFRDAGHKDGKYNPGRDSGPVAQSIEQGFSQAPRKYQERNFPGDAKAPFSRGPSKTGSGNSFKSRVPSLFDITVERPPGLRSPPGKERKPRIWEQDNFDVSDKDDKTVQRKEGPWLLNPAWVHNNSPWIKPWELGRVVGESVDKNFRSDAWQKEPPRMGVRSDDKGLAKDIRKSDVDNPEYPGYVGKLLTNFDNFNVLPPNASDKNVPGFLGESVGKLDENMENKLKSLSAGAGETDLPNPKIFTEEGQNYVQNFGRGPFEGSQGESDNRMDDLFGRDDCDERVRFERPNFSRDGRRGERRFNDPVKRDGRGFAEEGRVPGNKPDDDRNNGKGDKNSFEKTGGGGGGSPFSTLEDVDERRMRNRDRRGRGFDDRDDRPFRGHLFDRDERRNHGNFDRFRGNTVSGAKDVEWNPQVFDYSKGNKQGFRSQFPEGKDNFHISNVMDYSHGEKKQTFDYAHGESKADKKIVMSFDYAHGADSRSVIDYGHGSERDGKELLDFKREIEDDDDNNDDGSRSPLRMRSPKAEPRSRSRSPIPGREKTAAESEPAAFRIQRPKGSDRAGKPNGKRSKRNNSQEKSEPGKDEDGSKNNFNVTTVLVEDLICSPGRETRPNKLVFIIRGLPGSGKTYVTKLIKDKEVELGGDAPRILSLDDYFMTEVEKEVTDEETGRKIKKKVLEYEYESCAEPHYRGSLLKAFKKTVSDGFFSFIIVDSVNEKTKDYEEMWSFAKQKGFQVYVAEMDDDVAVCTKRNIHKRTEKEISDLAAAWEKTPGHFLRLDVRSLLQSDAITEVEMEVVSDTDPEKVAGAQKELELKEEETKEDEEEDEPGESSFVKSRWDHFENSEQKLDRLDGLKRRREGFHTTMEDYLQLSDDLDDGTGEPPEGKKKVRWADLEERRQQEKMRAIGFVVGQTDWSRMTDPTFGESALTRTKYI